MRAKKILNIPDLGELVRFYELKDGFTNFLNAFLTGRCDGDDISASSLRAWAHILQCRAMTIDATPDKGGAVLKKEGE